jgi:hypothetical protein
MVLALQTTRRTARRITFAGVAAAAMTVFIVLSGVSAQAQTLDAVLTKIIEANGGEARQRAVKSVNMNMEVVMVTERGEMRIPGKQIISRPAMTYSEGTFNGMTFKQGYDGKMGWGINPFNGQNDPAPMNPEEIKNAEETADIDGPFIDSKAKGYTIELMSKEDVEGTPTQKLKVTNKHGDIKYYFFDAESYLPIKFSSKTKTKEGTEIESETYMSEYKKVAGLQFPYLIETKVKGQTQMQYVFKSIELDKPVDSTLFVMPAKREKKDEPKKN